MSRVREAKVLVGKDLFKYNAFYPLLDGTKIAAGDQVVMKAFCWSGPLSWKESDENKEKDATETEEIRKVLLIHGILQMHFISNPLHLLH